MNKILDHLKKVEGDAVHYNDGEKDITAPYGIYKYAHPNAEIFQYIENLADKAGILKKTPYWDDEDIGKINSLLDENTVEKLVASFYEDYLKDAHLYLFPDECKVAMFDMFTNSPKGAWIAVQNSIISLVKSNQTGLILSDVSIADGLFGNKTRDAILYLFPKTDAMYFETLMLFNMTGYYISLWKENPVKYSKYLAGWYNRMNRLSKI